MQARGEGRCRGPILTGPPTCMERDHRHPRLQLQRPEWQGRHVAARPAGRIAHLAGHVPETLQGTNFVGRPINPTRARCGPPGGGYIRARAAPARTVPPVRRPLSVRMACWTRGALAHFRCLARVAPAASRRRFPLNGNVECGPTLAPAAPAVPARAARQTMRLGPLWTNQTRRPSPRTRPPTHGPPATGSTWYSRHPHTHAQRGNLPTILPIAGDWSG